MSPPSLIASVASVNAQSAQQAVTKNTPATRYDLMENVSLAFLLALKALTPAQRAVLLLRDVFDYSTNETAKARFCPTKLVALKQPA